MTPVLQTNKQKKKSIYTNILEDQIKGHKIKVKTKMTALKTNQKQKLTEEGDW